MPNELKKKKEPDAPVERTLGMVGYLAIRLTASTHVSVDKVMSDGQSLALSCRAKCQE